MESYKIKFNHRKIININITYEKSRYYSIIIYPALENCLFGAVTLTKHADINQYKCSGYENLVLIEKELSHLVMDLEKL